MKPMRSGKIGKRLSAIYDALYDAFGPQHWWPGDSPFEMMVGAMLTQNTAWTNVEKAIANLDGEGLLTPERLNEVSERRLASLIRPSGYFNVKAKRLKGLLALIMRDYSGSLRKMLSEDAAELRAKLLEVNGIGPETADSILLYAAEAPVFVVDAYTKRLFGRHGFFHAEVGYHEAQSLFMEHLPRDARYYNEYHALIVRAGKEYCRKAEPRCKTCPLERFASS
jgi:endonuclease III related protein